MTFGLASILGGKLAGRRRAQGVDPPRPGPALRRRLRSVTGHRGHVVPDPGPLLALLGFGAGLVAPPMNAAILASVEPGLAGIGSGVLNASRQIGTALGVAVFASLFVADGSPLRAVQLAMLAAGVLYLAAAAVVAMGRPTRSIARAAELRLSRPGTPRRAGFTRARARVPGRAPATAQAEENAGVGRRAGAGRRDHGRLGDFRTPGLVASSLGRPALTFVAWALGGAVGLLGALIFAELATRHPHAGGKYVYARESFGRRAGFVVGWSRR